MASFYHPLSVWYDGRRPNPGQGRGDLVPVPVLNREAHECRPALQSARATSCLALLAREPRPRRLHAKIDSGLLPKFQRSRACYAVG